MGRYKSRELIHFWVDYFKVSIDKINDKPRLDSLGLSVNSNFYFIDDDTYIELKQFDSLDNKYKGYYEIRDKNTNIALWFILISNGRKLGAVTYDSILEVSGQGLILREAWYYLELIKWLWYKTIKYKRVDICMDILTNTDYIIKNILLPKVKNKTITPFIKGGIYETLYIGNKSKSSNTRQIIRAYNKKLDSINKGKSFLYDYNDYKDVTRIELELRRDKAQFIDDKKLLDLEYLFWVYYNEVYKINLQFFKFIKYWEFKKALSLGSKLEARKKKKREERLERQIKYGNDFKNELDEKKSRGNFIAYGKKLYKNWYKKELLIEIIQSF